MQLQFDANQDYQLAAIGAVTALFTGQPDASQTTFSRDETHTSLTLSETGITNRCALTDAQWLENLRAVQQENLWCPI